MGATTGIYKIIGRCQEGVKVNGYVLRDLTSGVAQTASKEAVEMLALNKLLSNCSGQVYDGKVVLKGINCKLVNLPNCASDGTIISKERELVNNKPEPLSIIARIIDGKNIVGYRVSCLSGNGMPVEKNVRREQILELAQNGRISNARVQRSNGKPLLRGVNCELAQLPAIRRGAAV